MRQALPNEMQRLQLALTLFAALWQGTTALADWRAGDHWFAGIELLICGACLLLGGLTWLGKTSLNQVGGAAVLLACFGFLAVLDDDVRVVRHLSSYTYMNATIVIGAAFAFLEVLPAVIVSLVLNVVLLLGAMLTPQPTYTLLAAEFFTTALLAYAVFHNRYVLRTRLMKEQVEEDMEGLSRRDPVTGLMTLEGLGVHLGRLWPNLDDYQLGHAALAVVNINQFQDVISRYGTESGDRIMQQVAVHLMQLSDLKDVTVRGNGAQFLLLLLNVQRRDVRARLNMLDERLTGALWSAGPTISLVSHFTLLAEADSPEDLLTLALQRAQEAQQQVLKEQGPNALEFVSD